MNIIIIIVGFILCFTKCFMYRSFLHLSLPKKVWGKHYCYYYYYYYYSHSPGRSGFYARPSLLASEASARAGLGSSKFTLALRITKGCFSGITESQNLFSYNWKYCSVCKWCHREELFPKRIKFWELPAESSLLHCHTLYLYGAFTKTKSGQLIWFY
jgi:hypothetical protein